MTLTLIKWIAILGGLTVLALALFTKKTFHVETFIPASPKQVWAALTDTEKFPEWNPVFIKVEGRYAEGSKLKNHVQEPGRVTQIDAKIAILTPEKELNQTGGLPGILTFNHTWTLEAVEGGTNITQHEVDRGFWLWFWDSSWVQPAYEKVSEALKARVLELQQK